MLSLGEVIDRYASGDTTEMDITVILMERAIGGDRQRLGDELWTEIVDDLVESPSRMMLSMGDRAVGADDFDLAVACYTAHVRAAEPDAAILAQTGRFLLTRVGASLCPMSPSDFEKDPEFEIYGDVPFEIRAGVLFPSDLQEPILELGVEAFARAIELLELVDDLDKWNPEWDELVQALLALDGLRCGLLMLGRLVDLDPVLAATFELCDLWEEEGPPSFSAVFRERTRETSAWLKGVRGQHFWTPRGEVEDSPSSDPVAPTNLDEYVRVIRWQGREILDTLRDLAPPLAREISLALQRSPGRDFAQIDREMSEAFANKWNELPDAVQRMLSQAERLRAVFSEMAGIEWGPVVAQYGRALEGLLELRLRDRLIDLRAADPNPSKRPAKLAQLAEGAKSWTVGDYSRGLQEVAPRLAQRPAAEAVSRGLREFAEAYRNPASHWGAFVDPERARYARLRLLGGDGTDGLLWQVQALRL